MRNATALILLALPAWVACAKGKSGSGSSQGETEQPADTPATVQQDQGAAPEAAPKRFKTLDIWLQSQQLDEASSLTQDAYDHTFGVMMDQISLVLDGYAAPDDVQDLPVRVNSTRVLYLRDATGGTLNEKTLDPTVQEELSSFCRDLFVSPTESFVEEPDGAGIATLGLDAVWIAWRSHHDGSSYRRLGELLLARQWEFKCGLEVTVAYDDVEVSHPLVFTFDPAPYDRPGKHPLDFYRGASEAHAASAVEDGLMLVERRPQKGVYPDATYSRFAISGKGALVRNVKALTTQGFSFASSASGETCEFRLTDALLAKNPEVAQHLSTTVTRVDGQAFKVVDAMSASAAGTGAAAACGALDLAKATNGFSANFTCEEYLNMKEAGHCGVRLSLENAADPGDRPEILRLVDDLPHTEIDLRDQQQADALVPEQSGNPIRGTTLTLSGFDQVRLSAVARAFDYWMLLSNDTFTNKFLPTISTIFYDGSSVDCTNAGAWAYVPGDEIHWCVGGAMANEDLDQDIVTYYHPYRAVTALHETLHSTGALHDWEDEQQRGASWTAIPPCGGTQGKTGAGGTAASAEIAYKFFTCEQDYCYAFKNAAKATFQEELDYSLKDDPRRFLGLCDTWAAALGISFE